MRRALALLLAAAVWATQADAQPAAEASAAEGQRLVADLREEVLRLDVTVKDLYGREETRNIAVTVFRPRGDGPFPLAIMSHGRAPQDRRASQGRQRFVPVARYLVGKGFTVFVPTRVGYGDTYGDFDPESNGECNNMRLPPMAKAASDQVLATLAFAKTFSWVDASRWVAIGQSVGGLATVATVSRQPEGLVAAINFAGGTGGSPQNRPRNPCSPNAVQRLWAQQAETAKLPMLWIYWENDLYWGPDWPHRWAKAFIEAGGQVSFHHLPAAGSDGHNGINVDMAHWVPLVDPWLAQAGFGARPRTP